MTRLNTTEANADLKTRVLQFQMMELPGQPMMMHMGTVYLVNDLDRENTRLTALVADLTAANAALAQDNARLGKRVEDARELIDNLLEAITASDRHGDRSLTITGPTYNLKWLLQAEEHACAWIAGGDA